MGSKSSKNPENSVVSTLVTDLTPVAQDFTELAIDEIFEEGLLKEIPVVKSFVALTKAHRSVRDYLYLKKVISFLGPLSESTIEKRKEFVSKTLNSDEEKEKFSEAVISLIERADSRNKSELYGKFFLAHIEGKYNYDDTLKICSMIDRSFWSDLVKLPEYIQGESEDNLLTGELYKCGFLTMTGFDSGQFIGSTNSGAIYTINWYGEQVAEMFQKGHIS